MVRAAHRGLRVEVCVCMGREKGVRAALRLGERRKGAHSNKNCARTGVLGLLPGLALQALHKQQVALAHKRGDFKLVRKPGLWACRVEQGGE